MALARVNDSDSGTVSAAMTLNIQPVNDAPVFAVNSTPLSETVTEPDTLITNVTATDIDSDTADLTYSLMSGADNSLMSIDDQGKLVFNFPTDFETPLDDDQDNVYNAIVTVTDGAGGVDTLPLQVTVTNANDAPTGLPSIAGAAVQNNNLAANTQAIEDQDGIGNYQFQWLRDGVEIDGATQPDYTLTQIDVGAALQVEIEYTDQYGNREGPLRSAQTPTVENVNDPPLSSDSTVTVIENTQHPITLSDIGFSDPLDGDELLAIVVESLPANGTLLLGTTLTSAGQTIQQSALLDGSLVFVPEPNAYGMAYDSFEYTVIDNGGRANGGQDSSIEKNTITFDVTEQNIAPTGILLDNNLLAENTDDADIGSLTVIDPDVDDVHILTVDDSRFEIINNKLRIKSGHFIDFEQEDEINLVFSATDSAGNAITEVLKITISNINESPELHLEVPDQLITTGGQFTLPNNTFLDVDDEELYYEARLPGGEPLPEWMYFDAESLTFILTGSPNDINDITIQLTATDSSLNSATTYFDISLEPDIEAANTETASSEFILEPAFVVKPAVTTTGDSDNIDYNNTRAGYSTSHTLLSATFKADRHAGTDINFIEVQETATESPQYETTQASQKPVVQHNEIADVILPPKAPPPAATLSALSESLKQNQLDADAQRILITNVSTTLAVGLSVGHLVWLLRSGLLLSSVMASLPSWRYLDPIPVLNNFSDDDEDDTETLETIAESHEPQSSPPNRN